VRRESVAGGARQHLKARAGDKRRQTGHGRDRGELQGRVGREDIVDDRFVFFPFQAAGRIKKVAPRCQQSRGGAQTLALRQGQAIDGRRRQAIADLRVIPERPGSAAGRVEENPLEPTRGQRRTLHVCRRRMHVVDLEPPPVLPEKAKPPRGPVERDRAPGPAEQEGRE